MAAIDKLLSLAIEKQASDLHISAGMPPCMRIHGDLVWLNAQALTHETNRKLFMEIMPERNRKQLEQKQQADFVYSLGKKARFRANVYMQSRGLAGAFRMIPFDIISVEALNLTPAMIALTRMKRGLVLVTGPTGSGKSTTLASMIDLINQTRKEHIITVEDPVEFLHHPKKCLVSQRQVGEHVNTFSDALTAALREDPDVILVGEMRDLDTISLALSAAETGHLVYGTLHTNSAAKTVDRIIDAFPSQQQEQIRTMLSESLKGVICQALLKRIDKPGRIAAFEVLLGTPALANIIREKKTQQITSLMQTGKAMGMQLMDQALLDLAKQGKIRPADAYELATEKKLFAGMVSRKDVGIVDHSLAEHESSGPSDSRKPQGRPGPRG
jgi:twitching motility protein PilT